MTLHMNLISLKKSKTFFIKFSKKVTFKTTFWKHKCPFYWGVVVFQNICLFVVFFCLFVSLYLLALLATLPLCCHFVAHLPFCGSFAYFKILCKKYSDVTLTHQKTEGAEFWITCDYLFSVVLASYKWFKISSPGFQQWHMWQLDSGEHSSIEIPRFFWIQDYPGN